MKKHTDLQPWLDYFDMLRIYEEKGFLEVMPEKHEAYVTQPALHAMSEGDNPQEQFKKAIPDTVIRIRAYAAWKSQWMASPGSSTKKQNFALHVVEAEQPHDLIYTLLLTQNRRWQNLWRNTDSIEVISYTKKKQA